MKRLTGVYEADLPLPNGSRVINIAIDDKDGLLSGTMQDPNNPAINLPLTGSVEEGGKVRLSAKGEDIIYQSEGSVVGDINGDETVPGLLLDVTAMEEKELAAGPLVSSENRRREYLVGVHSPGGVRENHFVIETDGDVLFGEMYCVADEKTVAFLKEMKSEGKLPPFVKIPKPGDKTDVNALTGRIDGNSVVFSADTEQGSLFTFEGTANEDELALSMKIVDTWKGVKANSL
jgi:hypothetical protein